MAALSYCFELLAGGPTSLAAEAASAVVDGLDNFEYATRKALGSADLSPSDYPLLDRELQWQQMMLSALEGGLSVESAKTLRRANRAFAVPSGVAVRGIKGGPTSRWSGRGLPLRVEAGMKQRRLRGAWCCCHRTGHAAHRGC